MAVYYIDLKDGKRENTGLSEEMPLNDYKNLDLKKGDTVLFKRGTYVRDRLYNQNGITYGAYGEGENPVFCGSKDVCRADLWTEVDENIWNYNGQLETDVCNFIYNDETCGALRWEYSELQNQGDWFDNCLGKGTDLDNHEVFIYSKQNPALYYNSIECVLKVNRSLASNGEDMNFYDLTFVNNGIHGIAGEGKSKNLHVKNCKFRFIGGSVWSKEQKIRFGNAFECWNVCENVIVENCTFDDIYDSGVTHQGGMKRETAKNFIIKNNLFVKCGMAAYEQRDLLPQYAEFSGNICRDAGEGFSKLGEEMPRYSEIWPEPMGHHIFLWRIEKPTENGMIKIENNTFEDAPYGKAIYSIIAKEAEEQLKISNNICKGTFLDGNPWYLK